MVGINQVVVVEQRHANAQLLDRRRLGAELGALQCLVDRGKFKNNCLEEMWSVSDDGSYLRLIDCCITQL